MSNKQIQPERRLCLEMLESRAMLSGSPLSNGSFQLEPILDPFAGGSIFSTGSSGILTGATFSTNGGFSGGGFATGGGFSTNSGFPSVGIPTASGLPNDNGLGIPARLGIAEGIPLPTGVGPSGVGYADATTVGLVIGLGVQSRFGNEADGGDVSGGFESTDGSSFDAASGVGQMLIATGANTFGGTILPTAGYSQGPGGTGGPVPGKEAPGQEPGPERGKEFPGMKEPTPTDSALDSFDANVRAGATDTALLIYLEAAGYTAA